MKKFDLSVKHVYADFENNDFDFVVAFYSSDCKKSAEVNYLTHRGCYVISYGDTFRYSDGVINGTDAPPICYTFNKRYAIAAAKAFVRDDWGYGKKYFEYIYNLLED